VEPGEVQEVYLKLYSKGPEAKAGLDDCFRFYNTRRPHQDLGVPNPSRGF